MSDATPDCPGGLTEGCACCERFHEIMALLNDACLDHSCGLEGWDETCAECRLARRVHDYFRGAKA